MVPGRNLCQWASSAADAVTVPVQHVAPSGRATNGLLRDPRIDLGTWRERRRPAQMGHLHLVAPSASGLPLRWKRNCASWLNASSYLALSSAVAFHGRHGQQTTEFDRDVRTDELTLDQERAACLPADDYKQSWVRIPTS